MNSEILDAYFGRIGYEGERKPTFKVLKKLHELHPQAIAFENLNPVLKIPVRLDLESLQKKLIREGRGGYCFEQNLIFKEVLETLGFHIKGLSARILWNIPEGVVTSRGHMLLLINIDGKRYVADVGFGGLTLTSPLLLEPDIIQQTPHEAYRLLKPDNGDYIMQAKIKGKWNPLYRFDLQEQFIEDYEVTNWYLSNHPESHFVTGLIAARPGFDPGRRYNLRGNKLSIHTGNESTEKRTVKTVEELKDVLESIFLIRLSDISRSALDEKLQKIIEAE